MGLRRVVWHSDLFSEITGADGSINTLVKARKGEKYPGRKAAADSSKTVHVTDSKNKHFLFSKH